MKPAEIKQLQNICMAIAELKSQLIEDLPHFGNQSLFFQNDEITTGLLNNAIEIKIHLGTGQLHYYNNEQNQFIDLFTDDITKSLTEMFAPLNIHAPGIVLENIDYEKIEHFRSYALRAKHMLELFRMKLRGNFTLIHLWPHHFDFSLEWFSGVDQQQIGIGVSPGDETNTEPYLYMNPFPFNESIIDTKLPLGTWHTDSWKGVKIEWKDLLKYPPLNAANKLHEIFDVVKTNFN